MNLETAGPTGAAAQTKNGDSSSTATKTMVAASPVAPAPGKSEKPANPWETLQAGSRVLAAYWGETREFEGFWPATVKRVEGGEFTLEWMHWEAGMGWFVW